MDGADCGLNMEQNWMNIGQRIVRTDGSKPDYCMRPFARMPFQKPGGGFVYLVDGGNGRYKIGKSIHAEWRFENLQKCCPCKLRLVAYGEFKNYQEVERIIHRNLEAYRAHNEWFDLPDNVAKQLEDYLNGNLGRD